MRSPHGFALLLLVLLSLLILRRGVRKVIGLLIYICTILNLASFGHNAYHVYSYGHSMWIEDDMQRCATDDCITMKWLEFDID